MEFVVSFLCFKMLFALFIVCVLW